LQALYAYKAGKDIKELSKIKNTTDLGKKQSAKKQLMRATGKR
jgi:hypothetical protein